MDFFTKITSFGLVLLLVLLFLLMGYASINHDPHWYIQDRAVPSADHPLSGFWKQQSCEEPWGWAIGPVSPGIYYISFCGPGGCFDRGEYRPDTSILDDPDYRVVDQDTLMVLTKDGWSTMDRCESRN